MDQEAFARYLNASTSLTKEECNKYAELLYGDKEVPQRIRDMHVRFLNVVNDRNYLKSKGWRRCDRASGPNKSIEYWVDPIMDRGYEVMCSPQQAVRRQQRRDAVHVPIADDLERYKAALTEIRESGDNLDRTCQWMQHLAAHALDPKILHPGPLEDYKR